VCCRGPRKDNTRLPRDHDLDSPRCQPSTPRRSARTRATRYPTDRSRNSARGASRPSLAAVSLVGAALAAVVVGLVFLGRWEGRRHERAEIAGMRRVFELVGPLDNRSLSAYRIDIDFEFDCLIYRRGPNRYALELCFDRSGRLAEAIDRRRSKEVIASLREDPGASTIRVSRALVVKLLKRLGAPPPRGGWR